LPAEIIIVDQSDDDLTRMLVEQYRSDYGRLHYIHQRRRGLAASRNAAIAASRTSIIAVTDDDCVPDHQWIACIDSIFISPRSPDAVAGRVLPLGPDRPGLYPVSSRTSTERVDFHHRVAPWLVGTGGNFAVKRAWAERIGGFDERLGAGSSGQAAEDIDLIYRLLCAGAHLRCEPYMLVCHQRQTRTRRVTSRSSYGHGIGAFCGIWIRAGDLFALYTLMRWVFHQWMAQWHALRSRQWDRYCEGALMVQGAARGLAYGLRLQLWSACGRWLRDEGS
jgi:glycosyltransferase involved in cell wall biosynthesis